MVLISCGVQTSRESVPASSELNSDESIESLDWLSVSREDNAHWLIRALKHSIDQRDRSISYLLPVIERRAIKDQAARKLLAEYYLIHHEYEAAFKLLLSDENTALDPHSYNLKTQAAIGLKNYGLAIDLVNQGMLTNPTDSELYNGKGDLYMALKDTAMARKNYLKSYRLDSLNSEVVIKLSSILIEQGRLDEAEKLLSREKSKKNKSLEVLRLLADLYSGQQKIDQAKDIWRTLYTQGDEAAGYHLLQSSEASLEYDSVLFYAQNILDKDSLDAQALVAKARVYELRGYTNSAIAYYQRVLNQDSTHEVAKSGLEKVYRKIAYLRRIKEQRAATPRLEFKAPRKNTVEINE